MARLDIEVNSSNPSSFFGDYVFVPNQIWKKTITLDPKGETEIVIPDSLLPQANFGYHVTAVLKTSDNETKTKKLRVNYYHKNVDLEISTSQDSITVKYTENGYSKATKGTLELTDYFGNSMLKKEISLPTTIPLNTHAKYVVVKAEEMVESFDLSYESSRVSVYSDRTSDSLEITFQNPRKIPCELSGL